MKLVYAPALASVIATVVTASSPMVNMGNYKMALCDYKQKFGQWPSFDAAEPYNRNDQAACSRSNENLSGEFDQDFDPKTGNYYIRVKYSDRVSNYDKDLINKKLQSAFHDNTCIRFVEDKYGNTRNWRSQSSISVDMGPDDCSAFLGTSESVNNGENNVNFNMDCLKKNGRVEAVFMHALGFLNHHQRSDRDKNVKVYTSAVPAKYQESLTKISSSYSEETHGAPYDCESILQYGFLQWATSRRKLTVKPRTVLCKKGLYKIYNAEKSSANNRKMTEWDIYSINAKYPCKKMLDVQQVDGKRASDFAATNGGFELQEHLSSWGKDPCANVDCGNGQCRKGARSFYCVCDSGYEWLGSGQCTNIDDCANNDRCGAHGTCVDELNDFRCECESDYENARNNDKICQRVNKCDVVDCGYNGSCKYEPDSIEGYACNCGNGAVFDFNSNKCKKENKNDVCGPNMEWDEYASPCGKNMWSCEDGIRGWGPQCDETEITEARCVCKRNHYFYGEYDTECMHIDDCKDELADMYVIDYGMGQDDYEYVEYEELSDEDYEDDEDYVYTPLWEK